MPKPPAPKKTVDAFRHDDKRRNIPTAEYVSLVEKGTQAERKLRYPRNVDLDPQLVWRGKDEQDWSELVVDARPLYIQEKVHPKALIDELRRMSDAERKKEEIQLDLFSDFNGIPEGADKTEFYQHEQNWSNRMILGDSLQAMASLADREGLRGQVQCIYLDPPYGIKFNSNFQWSTTSRDVKDGNKEQITREPEQVKAFRDTWRDGIHSYLTYLRDRLTVARDLLSDSGSIFVQIGDENVHRVRALMDEVFGDENRVSMIQFTKTGSLVSDEISNVGDYLLFYAKKRDSVKFRPVLASKDELGISDSYSWVETIEGTRRALSNEEKRDGKALPDGARFYQPTSLISSGASSDDENDCVLFKGKYYQIPGNSHWKTTALGITRLTKSTRIQPTTNSLRYVRYLDDYSVAPISNIWTGLGTGSFTQEQVYVVQTSIKVIQRCILMSTDPGDLVLDPTCGSGTTAYVAEQWGRRWITMDTSRVALALARARIMGARYPYYLLADSREGLAKEAELAGGVPSSRSVHGSLRQGFVYERVPHVTLKSIANNAEIDVIWDRWQEKLEPLRARINAALKTSWEEWEIPRDADGSWGDAARSDHAAWWAARIARQKEIDASIAAKAEYEYLYDKPYPDKSKVRVAGPFTVESLSPHRVLGVDEHDELIDAAAESGADYAAKQSFPKMVLDNLRTAGVQQAHKEDRIAFTSLVPWGGEGYVCAEGHYLEGDTDRRAAIFIGGEFGTVQRADLVAAAREAADAGFDVLISCAFNYEAHATEFSKLGRIPVLKARMNADLHMADDLKNTGKGNLFVIFGEPDIELSIIDLGVDAGKLRVRVKGVDVFKPQTGEVVSCDTDGIACWFVDTDYDEESFFVRQAYFLGSGDPYGSLKTSLKAEIDEEAWATLHSDVSRPFDRPTSGRIAVKVINHLGDEVMKVFRV